MNDPQLPSTPGALITLPPAVIDRGKDVDRIVAKAFNAALVPANNVRDAANRALIFVADDPASVPTIRRVASSGANIRAVVSWQLPESSLSTLLDLPSHIALYIGIPKSPSDPPVDRGTETELNTTLARLENLLIRHHRGEENRKP